MDRNIEKAGIQHKKDIFIMYNYLINEVEKRIYFSSFSRGYHHL